MNVTKKQAVVAFTLILLLGAILRFALLGENSFVADEFLDMNSAYGYRQTGEWKAWDFNFGQLAEMNANVARDERAFVYKWQVAALFGFLSPTEAHARTMSVLWGILSIAVVFWSTLVFTRKKEIGLLAAFLTAVSVSAIIYSRRLRMYAMFFPVYLALATTLFAFYEREYRGKIAFLRSAWQKYGLNLAYLPIALVTGVLAILVHQLSAHIALSLGLYLLLMSVLAFREGKSWKNKYTLSFFFGLLGLLSVFIFVPKVASSFLKELTFFDNHYSYFGYLSQDFATLLIGFALTIGGIVVLARRMEGKREALWLGTTLFLPFLMAVFMWNRNAGPQYVFFLQSFVLILSSITLFFLAEEIGKRFTDAKKGIWIALLLVMLLTPNWAYFFLENNTYHETSSGGNPNYRKVFAYFKKEKQPGDVLITRNFRNYYWSGAKVPVYDFGGEVSRDKLTIEKFQKIVAENPSGWFIVSTNDYDYISPETESYVKDNFTRVSNAQVRGDIDVYRWGTL